MAYMGIKTAHYNTDAMRTEQHIKGLGTRKAERMTQVADKLYESYCTTGYMPTRDELVRLFAGKRTRTEQKAQSEKRKAARTERYAMQVEAARGGMTEAERAAWRREREEFLADSITVSDSVSIAKAYGLSE